jgi:hypothetical protein
MLVYVASDGRLCSAASGRAEQPRAPPSAVSFPSTESRELPLDRKRLSRQAGRLSDKRSLRQKDRDDDASKHISPRQPCKGGHVLRSASASTSLLQRAPTELLPGRPPQKPRSAVRGTDMLAAHTAGHGLESIQALIVAVCVLIVVFWRIALTMLLAVAAILMLVMITSGAAVLLQDLLHLVK